MKVLVQEEVAPGLRIAPLLDVVFLLLIFFLVATTFYEAEKDLLVKLAEATTGKERVKTPTTIIVNIRQSGIIVVDQRIYSLEQLENLLATTRRQGADVIVVIRCDKLAFHKHFVSVLNVCEKVGVRGVAVATTPVE